MLKPNLLFSAAILMAGMVPVAQAHPGHDHTNMVLNTLGIAVLGLLLCGPVLNTLLGRGIAEKTHRVMIRIRRK